jgi:hypothetical protein
MDLKAIAAELLKLIEQDGPQVLGLLLEQVAPGLPVEALVGLAEGLDKLLTAGNEKQQMQAAVEALESGTGAVPTL